MTRPERFKNIFKTLTGAFHDGVITLLYDGGL